jgi:hypothetical protein
MKVFVLRLLQLFLILPICCHGQMTNKFPGFPSKEDDTLRHYLQSLHMNQKIGQDESIFPPFPTPKPENSFPPPILSPNQGVYATLTLNEEGTIFTQEAIRDTVNNLLIISVPAHNGNFAAKTVFDGDSDLMMIVRFEAKTCSIQKSFLEGDVDTLFEAMKPMSMERDAMRSGKLKTVKEHVSIAIGYSLKPEALPRKFQPHCPPDFEAHMGHTVNGPQPSMENILSVRKLETLGDFFDFKPSIQIVNGRSNGEDRQCTTLLNDGTMIELPKDQCHMVKFNCSLGTTSKPGCPNAQYRFSCIDKGPGQVGCLYELAYCRDENGVNRDVCMKHIYYGNSCCRPCCGARKCVGLQWCGDMDQSTAIQRACMPHGTPQDCDYLEVILKNDVLRFQDMRVGLYKKGGIINGKKSWTTEQTKEISQAIWFDPQSSDWAIGPLEKIGTKRDRGITSIDDKDQSLFDVPNDRWQYYNNWDYEWKDIKDGDITIKCVDPVCDWSTPIVDQWECCSRSKPCGLNEGDCDSDYDCLKNLRCGSHNCPNHFHELADCCYDPN